MRNSVLLALICLLSAACATSSSAPMAAVPSAGTEDAAVRAALDHYLLAHATGDGAHHRRVFHPVSKLFWIREGKFAERTSEDYINGSPGKPAVDEAQRKRTVEWIDVTGDIAVAKLVLDYPDVILTDYMTLLRIDGEWKIVNKVFHRAAKKK